MRGSTATPFRACAGSIIKSEIPFAVPLAEAALKSQPGLWGSRFTLDSTLLALTRTGGLDTRRLSTTGGWELPWVSGLGDQYRLRLSLHGDGYLTDGDPESFSEDGGTSTTGRVLPRMTADWSWPWIGEALGVTPLLEPVASFTWTLDDPNYDDIPNEDSQDLEFDDSNLFQPNRFAGVDRVEGGAKLATACASAARRPGRAGERPVRPELPVQRRAPRVRCRFRHRRRRCPTTSAGSTWRPIRPSASATASASTRTA